MSLIAKIAGLFKRKPKDGRPEGYGTDTEFCAEVVRVTGVKPHPNADRLDLVQFDMATGPCAYQVVSGRGEFKAGDLAGYFSVDSIVPTAHPNFKFLTERLDGQGKATYRLRAARLRGIFSQGLLVPVSGDRPVGQFLGTEYGVTYHQPEVKGDAFPQGKVKKPKKQPMPIYTVDSLKKLPTLFAPDEPICITEKIHGTNFRFGWVRRRVLGIPFGWTFVVGSHRTIRAGQGHSFYKSDVYTEAAERMALRDVTKNDKGSIFFGELYGHTYTGEKIQDLVYGTLPGDGPRLAIFDIKSPTGWLAPEERLLLCDKLSLPHVPVLAGMDEPFENFAKFVEGKSCYDHKQLREGVVVESTKAPRRKAKYVSEAYLMRKDA